MKAPGDSRPTWRNGIIQIHITRACDLSCIGCTQGSNLAGKPVVMSLENFERACESLKDYYGVLGIFGGSPTLHPKFKEICRIFEQIIPFEQRGLWSNNLNGYGSLCREIFNPAVSNLNVHTSITAYQEMKREWPECNPIGEKDSRHSPPYVAIKDVEGLTNEQKQRLIESCDINQLWSAMVCQFRGELRGYFCELAGAQSMLRQAEEDYPDTGITIEEGWWKQPIERFQHQIDKHCWECGIPLRGFGDLAVTGKIEYVSETHKNIYNLKRKNGKEIKLVKKLEDMDGHVQRATDYISNGEITKMTEAKIFIAVPTKGMTANDHFYDFYNMLERPEGTIQTFARGQSPARNRNIMIQQALDHNATHILFLDDDTAPPPDLLRRLYAYNKDVITALYLMRNFPHQPIIFDYTNEKGECRWHEILDEKPGLIEIFNCGLGACLIKTDVFRKMSELGLATDHKGVTGKWIRLGEAESDHWCDDVSFFNRVRSAGFKLFCDTRSEERRVGKEC